MEIRRLGDFGPDLSLVGLGCANFGMKIGTKESEDVVHAALDLGITHFDTAEIYGGGDSEVFLGRALGSCRDEVVIATKFAPRNADAPYMAGDLRRRIFEACDESLRRLRTDRIDLYYQHLPDVDAAPEEALDALDQLVHDGKVVYIASSNVDAQEIDSASNIAAERNTSHFVATQLHWNLLHRGPEEFAIPAACHNGLGVVPYYPLASGLLTGKYRRGHDFPEGSRFAFMSYFAADATDEKFAALEELSDFAAFRGHSILELAMAWLAAHEFVGSIIAGAVTPEQVRANVAASAWKLEAEDLVALNSMGVRS